MKLDEMDEELFRRVYRESAHSINPTAKALGVSPILVEKLIEKYNIDHKWKHRGGHQRTQPLTKENLEKDYIVDGLTIAQMSVKYNVSRNILYRRCREYGIKLRRESKRRIDLTNDKYGLLRVISLDHVNEKGRSYWLCKCECGTKKVVSSKNLRAKGKRGRTGSCGCMKQNYDYGILDESKWIFPRFVWTGIVRNANDKNREMNITPEYISRLYIDQKGLCSISGVEIQFSEKVRDSPKEQTASLDRIDSSKGYIIGNCQWIHKDLQSMKLDRTQEKFINWCKIIAEYNKDEKIQS